MCGAEKGRNKFLEIMDSEENADKHYQLLHWKEILTAIIKDDVPVPLCDSCEYSDSCSHSENMLSTIKPAKREIMVLQKEKFTDIDTAYMDLQNAFQRAAESQDNRIYIIKGQTALGKTSTYIEYMKTSSRPVLIAVPTHELKEQIIRDAKEYGVDTLKPKRKCLCLCIPSAVCSHHFLWRLTAVWIAYLPYLFQIQRQRKRLV